jgi:hypothetical protein
LLDELQIVVYMPAVLIKPVFRSPVIGANAVDEKLQNLAPSRVPIKLHEDSLDASDRVAQMCSFLT